VARVSELNVLIAVKHHVWGASRARFRKWAIGDYLVLKDASGPIALARVAGKPFQSMTSIWTIDLFPYRISVDFLHFLASEDRPTVAQNFREILLTGLGNRYGIRIRTQSALPTETGRAIIKLIRTRSNALKPVQCSIDSLICGECELTEVTTERQ
jgi:hypothetical protein